MAAFPPTVASTNLVLSMAEVLCSMAEVVQSMAGAKHVTHSTPVCPDSACMHVHTVNADAVRQYRDHGPVHASGGHPQHPAHGRFSHAEECRERQGAGVLLRHAQPLAGAWQHVIVRSCVRGGQGGLRRVVGCARVQLLPTAPSTHACPSSFSHLWILALCCLASALSWPPRLSGLPSGYARTGTHLWTLGPMHAGSGAGAWKQGGLQQDDEQ